MIGDVLGWERVQVAPKHRYVAFEGPAALELRARCRFPVLPYPKAPKLSNRRYLCPFQAKQDCASLVGKEDP